MSLPINIRSSYISFCEEVFVSSSQNQEILGTIKDLFAKVVAQQSIEQPHKPKFFPTQEERIETAKLAAQKDAWITSIHIQNYKITDQRALMEIHIIATQSIAQSDPITAFQYIQKYRIIDGRPFLNKCLMA